MIRRTCTAAATLLLAAVIGLGLGASRAAATSITLDGSLSGSTLSVLVGLSDVSRIQAYTLDFTWDPTELSFTSAEQLGSTEVATGFFSPKAFTVDPNGAGSCAGAASPDPCRRASVLAVPPEILYLDGRTNLPSADTREGLLALELEVLALVGDAMPDLTVGFLNPEADAISEVSGDPDIVLEPTSTSLSVPEPGTAGLLALALAGGAALRRRR